MATSDLSDRPWVLLPGTLCTGAVFDPFLDSMGVDPRHRQTVALDRPHVTDYADEFDGVTPDTVVCGFSLGAITAAHAADQMTPYCLILFGLNPFADDPAKAQGRHSLCADVQRDGGASALGARTPEVFGDAPEHTRRMIYDMADQTSHHIGAQTQLALSRPGALPALSRAGMPVLCLTGSRDAAAPAEQGRAAAQSAKNGTFYELDGLGHFALIEDPQACATAVRKLYEACNDPV